MSNFHRSSNILTKMTRGTMGGESRVANPWTYDEPIAIERRGTALPECPVHVNPWGFPLGHSTPDFNWFYGTYTAVMHSGFTRITIYDDVTDFATYGNGPGMGFTVLTFPALEFVSRHQFCNGDREAYPSNFAVDEAGVVYFWEQDDMPLGTADIIKQDGDAWEVIHSWVGTNQRDGLMINPYDGMLYDLIPQNPGEINRFDPVTGAVEMLYTGLETGSDMLCPTPDGALWCDYVTSGSSSSSPVGQAGLHRYDIATDTITRRTFTQIPSIPWTSTTIPAWGLMGANEGDVLYRSYQSTVASDRYGVKIEPNWSYGLFTCDPMGAPSYTIPETGGVLTGIGTARTFSSGSLADWRTVFIWPSGGGFGEGLWYIGPPIEGMPMSNPLL